MITAIDSADALRELCQRLASEPLVAVDTEFVGEHSYYPHLALVQIGVDRDAWLVDPLAAGDLTPLRAVLDSPRTTVLMHDAEIDLQILNRATGARIANLFDTQLAAAFVGLSEAAGLATLVKRVTGKRLAKGQQVTDWLKRPLNEKQRRYAAEDVLYLGQIHRFLSERLTALGRLELFQEEMGQRREHWLLPLDVASRFRKLLESAKLSGGRRQAMEELLRWREKTAQTRNIPRRHVLPDETVLAVALQLPQSVEELQSLRVVSEKAAKRYGDELVALSCALRAAPEAKEHGEGAPRNGRRVQARAPLVKLALELIAEQAGIAPGLIARADEIEAICRAASQQASPPDLPSLTGWRGRLVGDRLWRVARGELGLRVGLDPKQPPILFEETPPKTGG
ncbi:MAG: hypothetical protein C4523_19305 [Myxococcales bacterium]|nr:MAG: hypothetical protein C4523_19305 [Myxococcales bacterium]